MKQSSVRPYALAISFAMGLVAPAAAQAQVCGNSIVEAGEACDDGNLAGGDCCSALCEFEAAASSCSDGNVCNGDEICDGAGSCMAGTPLVCDDGDLCSQDGCDAVSGCTNDFTPRLTCNETMRRARLRMRQIDPKPRRNQVGFKWKRGDVSGEDLGDPTTTSDYALCVYDAEGIVASSTVPAGAACGDRDCWKDRSRDDTTRLVFADRQARHEGMKRIKLQDGADDASIRARATGADLLQSDLGGALMTPVTAQLVTSDADCWSTTFEAEDVRLNVRKAFDARHKAELPD